MRPIRRNLRSENTASLLTRCKPTSLSRTTKLANCQALISVNSLMISLTRSVEGHVVKIAGDRQVNQRVHGLAVRCLNCRSHRCRLFIIISHGNIREAAPRVAVFSEVAATAAVRRISSSTRSTASHPACRSAAAADMPRLLPSHTAPSYFRCTIES